MVDSPSGPAGPPIKILDALFSRSAAGWGVRELAEHLGLSRTTTHRLLTQLTDQSWAIQGSGDRYLIGPRAGVLAEALQGAHSRLRRMPQALAELQQHVGGTVFLSTQAADGSHGQVAVVQAASDSVRYLIENGARIPLTAGAAGLALLAAMGPDRWKTQDSWPTFTSRTAPADDRRALMEGARGSGFVVSVGQHIPDAAGIAAPLELSPGVFGSISVSRPVWEFDPESIIEVADQIKKSIVDLPAAAGPGPSTSSPNPLPRSNAKSRHPVTQASRLDRLLTLLSTAFPLDAVELSKGLGSGARATLSLLDSALQSGLAHQDPDGLFWPGPRLVNWLTAIDPHPKIEDLTAGILQALAADVQETVGLSTVDADGVTTIRKAIPSHRTVQYVLETGVELPPDRGAISKAILAHLPDLAERTRANPDEMSRIRSNGYAVAEGERIPEAFGIGAAFFKNGIVAGAVNVSIPRARIDRTQVAELGIRVAHAAEQITELISTLPTRL